MIYPVSADELLQRITSQPEDGNIWLVIITPTQDHEDLVNDLYDTLGIFIEGSIDALSGSRGLDSLLEALNRSEASYSILAGFKSWGASDWQKLDRLRSRLMRRRGACMILDNYESNLLFRNAPNLASWIGPRVYPFTYGTELLTEEEQQSRLQSFQQWSGQTDAEVIALAETQSLPSDPEYGEWLVLLGRGDLIER